MRPARSALARKLIVSMIGVSGLVALVITAAQLFMEYRREMDAIDAHFAIIEQSYLPSIEETVWLLDHARLNTLLAGIARLPDFRHAEVISGGKVVASGGSHENTELITRIYPLHYDYRGRRIDIGGLSVDASVGAVRHRVWERAGFILAANTLKTLLVAFFMLWLVRNLVVRRLVDIAAQTARFGVDRSWTPIRERDSADPQRDEIDALVTPLNRMAARHEEMFAELERQVREKEVLLKEVYHRVKNNLQVVASLLNLQGRAVADGRVKEVLRESADRVKSMALVHEQLYRSQDLSNISLSEYLGQLVEHLMAAHRPLSSRVAVKLEAAQMTLGIEAAVPLGLIVNELVSNAYKHGYGPDTVRGQIVLGVQRLEGGRVRLEVADDGRGLPAGFEPQGLGSLGLQLVLTLAQQLDGELRCATNAGHTSFEVAFPLEINERERKAA